MYFWKCEKTGGWWIIAHYEILRVINSLESFRLLLNQPFIIKTNCEAIIRFYNKTNEKKLSSKRQLNFVSTITGNKYTMAFEHIKGIYNRLTNYLNKEIYSKILYDGRQENDLKLD